MGFVKIKLSKNLGVGGELWINTRLPYEVECQLGLGDEAIPEMKQEVVVSCSKASDEVVLKCADSLFSNIEAC